MDPAAAAPDHLGDAVDGGVGVRLGEAVIAVSLFERRQVAALHVLDDHRPQDGDGRHAADHRRDAVQARQLRGPPPALAGDDLEPLAGQPRGRRPRPDQQGLQDAVDPDRRRELVEARGVEDDAGVELGAPHVGDGDHPDARHRVLLSSSAAADRRVGRGRNHGSWLGRTRSFRCPFAVRMLPPARGSPTSASAVPSDPARPRARRRAASNATATARADTSRRGNRRAPTR